MDYVTLNQHAQALSRLLKVEVQFVEDVLGPEARKSISSLSDGEILLLDNLRFTGEENSEFLPEEAAKTIFVKRLSPLLDACVLDAFATSHRSSPSLIGLAEVLPTCAGHTVIRELEHLDPILSEARRPFVTVLGGAKVEDRLKAINTLIQNNRADKVLLCGVIANVFLRASHERIGPLGIPKEESFIKDASKLLQAYPGRIELPVDLAFDDSGERSEAPLNRLTDITKTRDIGEETIARYSNIISGGGTIFISGPPGAFETRIFQKGTESLLRTLAQSHGNTIISGGHLTAALNRFKIQGPITHLSTAGGALVSYLAGKKLPMIEALKRAAIRYREKKST
jgi:phosphoglycerate kinase